MYTDQATLDARIHADFEQPFLKDVGFDSWDEVMEDYGIENGGELLAECCVGGIGPVPDAFYNLNGVNLLDNLHGMMDPEFKEWDTSNGPQVGYEIEADRSEGGTKVFFYYFNDELLIEEVSFRPI